MVLILAICGFAVAALIWAHVGRVEVIATAQGKIEPVGKVKVVEPLETGRIARIIARNGDTVRTGDLLFTLGADELIAQYRSVSGQRAGSLAEMLRRQACILAAGKAGHLSTDIVAPPIEWGTLPLDIVAREQRILRAELDTLRSALTSIESQVVARTTNIAAITAAIQIQTGLMSKLDELVAMRQALTAGQLGSRADWLLASQAAETQKVTLATQQGTLANERATVNVLKTEAERLRSDFVADNTRQVAALEKQLADLDHQLEQIRFRWQRFQLTSPVDGIVQASTLTTIGQVVTTGEEVMRIVATDALTVQAYLPNDDRGFVSVGQEATIKVFAFPFTQYGTMKGRVISVASDAISVAEAEAAMLGSGANSATGGALGALVFPITVEIDANALMNDGNPFVLLPGMGVVAEINTGSRSILEYLFSPLVELGAGAMHER
jgi:hemolysin D